MFLDRTAKLTLLHSVLWATPDERVDLDYWRSADSGSCPIDLYDEAIGAYMIEDKHLVNLCGTTGCAIGWATAIPVFRALGFKMKDSEPTFDGEHGWDAVANFFELTTSETKCLFMTEPGDDDSVIEKEDIIAITGATSSRDREAHLTDREKVLRRIRKFLDNDCELDSKELKQLKKGEKIRKAKKD